MIISVIGGSDPSQESLHLAEEVGRELARRGVTLVTGGLTGVMEAACRGAKQAGGTTVGILPGNSPHEANPWVDIPICTGMGYGRNVLVVRAALAVIAIDGAYGTLSEIGFALGEGIPVVGLQTWNFSINGQPDNSILRATDPSDAVEKAIAAAQRRLETLAKQRTAP